MVDTANPDRATLQQDILSRVRSLPELRPQGQGDASSQGRPSATSEAPLPRGGSSEVEVVPGGRRPPAPAPAPAYRPVSEYKPGLSSTDYAMGVLRNAPGAAAEVGGNLYEALRPSNWDDTGAAIGMLGLGLASKANTALGGRERLPEGEAAVDAVWNDIKGRWENPAKSFYENPFAIGLDVASVAPVVGAAGRVAGMGKLATGVEKVASLGDPINLALQGAKLGTKAITRPTSAIARYPQAVVTGASPNALSLAAEAGRSADPIARKTFRAAMTGDADPRDIAKSAVAAMNEKKKAMSDGYIKRKAELTEQALPMTGIRTALDDAMMAANRYGTRADTAVVDALKRMDAKVKAYELHPDPGSRTAVELDLLKRDLQDIVGQLPPSDRGAVAGVPRSVRDTIASVDSGYADMMDYWQQWISTMKDLQSTLGTGDRVSETARLAKLMSTLKSGEKLSLLKQLEGTPSGKYLKEMIAGSAFRDIMPPALQGFGLGVLGPVLAGGPHGIAAAAAASPRLAGLTQYGIGRLEGAVNRIPTPPAAATNLLSQIGAEREGRKSGGRVGMPHEAAADQLVMAAERAKKGISKGTESLLDMSDNHIAHALEVANRSI